MALKVCMGAQMICSYGSAPSLLIVLPVNDKYIDNLPVANIMDHVSIVNIPPFGMCSSPVNPTVSTATMAALGVPTPMPCIPLTVTPWSPGAHTDLVGNIPTLHNGCICTCSWGGEITFLTAGQVSEEV